MWVLEETCPVTELLERERNDEPPAVDCQEQMIDRFTDFYLAFFDRMLTVAKGRIDILRAADDLGTQRGLFFSPEMFRAFLKPRLKKLVELAHSHEVKFLFHSCGAIRPVIEDLIEIGVDILDLLVRNRLQVGRGQNHDRMADSHARCPGHAIEACVLHNFATPAQTNEELIYYAAPSVPKTPRQSVKPNE